MFSAINEKTLYIFGICNIITIPMYVALSYHISPSTQSPALKPPAKSKLYLPLPSPVCIPILIKSPFPLVCSIQTLTDPPTTRVYALYPETNQRTLEEINLVFASDSIWTWDAEREFKILKAQNPLLVQASRTGSKADAEMGPGIGGSVGARGMSLDVGAVRGKNGRSDGFEGGAVELDEL